MFTQYKKILWRIPFVGVFAITSLALSSLAQAEGWYAGVGFGQSKVQDFFECDLDITCTADDTDTGWKLYLGNQFSPNAAVEFGYVDLGQQKISGTDTVLGTVSLDTEAKGFDVALVGFLPVGNQFNLLGKIGLFRWDADISASSTAFGSGSDSETGFELMFGFGASFDIAKTVAVRIEWERFTDVGDEDVTGTSDVDLLSASLVFKFK
ncbi:MAG: outer membrane beta-barrel protein [Gammaproteobacteria bacterium]|nr:outer membrane beta-barrel protein [Gammaproteobacteria bacterium]MDH5512170.1 outer membrane beta-barrel protein [Gammaproteobacteria bacterium]